MKFFLKNLPFSGFLKWIVVFFAVAAVFLISAFLRGGGERRPNLLALLHVPDERAPFIIVGVSGWGFPGGAFELFADSTTISPEGSVMTSLIPIFEAASDSALVITERGDGLATYGVFSLEKEEGAALAVGALPDKWARHFVMPQVSKLEGGVLRVVALNIVVPFYIETGDGIACVADSLEDIERMRLVRARSEKGIDLKWGLEGSWPCHITLSDGGVIGALASRGADSQELMDSVKLEVAWRRGSNDEERRANEGDSAPPAGEAKWKISGLGNCLDSVFTGSLRNLDWTSADIFIPDPLIVSFGINLPSPGKNASGFPSVIKALYDHLIKMGLKHADAQSVLTGQTVASLGGRTQILWFELPGIVLDIPGRGKVGHRLIERFWSDTFMGASPRAVDGFSTGGTTDLPFTVLAAANDEKAVIGLVPKDVEQNVELKLLLRAESDALAWLYADMPKLGAALAEMPSVNALFYEDEDRPIDTESTDELQKDLSALGSIFVVWDSPDSGRAMWF